MAGKLTEEQIARVKSLENDLGQLTPDAVLADARQKSSPLHPLFDWDKAKAAESWWRECARDIIRTVQLIVTTEHTTIKSTFYVRDPDATGQGYRSVEALKRDPASARQSLIDELTRAAGNVQRARMLAEALDLAPDFDYLLEQILGLRRKTEQKTAA